jgi:hypothetical protein
VVAEQQVVSDTFNRANSLTALGTADTGQVWRNDFNTLGVNTNVAAGPTASVEQWATVDVGNVNQDITCTMSTAAANGHGQIWSASSTANTAAGNTAYIADMNTNVANTGAVYSVIAGSFVSKGTLNQISSGTVVRVVRFGNLHTVYYGGVQQLQFTDNNIAATTRCGMRMTNTVSRHDNFIASVPLPLPNIIARSFAQARAASW